MFPFLVEALSNENVESNPSLTATALDLLASLIKNVRDPFPSVYTTQVFPRIVGMMLAVNEDALLQNGQETLKLLVTRDIEGIASWTDGVNNGIEYVMKLILKLLDPNLSEPSSIFVGDLVTTLIQKGGAMMNDFSPSLLSAVINRLEFARMPSFVQTLVLIFCHLIQNQLATVVDFLSNIVINEKTGLEIFITKWLAIFGEIQGFYAVKVSTVALTQLILSLDPRLNQIQLIGDLIINETPSKSLLI